MNDFLHSNIPSKHPNCVDRDGFVFLLRAIDTVHEVNLSPSIHSRVVVGVVFMLFVLVVSRRPCGFDLVFLEQTVSLIADEDEATQYLMQVCAFLFVG